MTTIEKSTASTLDFFMLSIFNPFSMKHIRKKKFIHETDEIRADGLLMIYKFITVSIVWVWIVRKK